MLSAAKVNEHEEDTHLHLPPPVTYPHLVVLAVGKVTFSVYPGRLIRHVFLKGRISNDLANTFNRMSMPQLKLLGTQIPSFVFFVTCHFEG